MAPSIELGTLLMSRLLSKLHVEGYRTSGIACDSHRFSSPCLNFAPTRSILHLHTSALFEAWDMLWLAYPEACLKDQRDFRPGTCLQNLGASEHFLSHKGDAEQLRLFLSKAAVKQISAAAVRAEACESTELDECCLTTSLPSRNWFSAEVADTLVGEGGARPVLTLKASQLQFEVPDDDDDDDDDDHVTSSMMVMTMTAMIMVLVMIMIVAGGDHEGVIWTTTKPCKEPAELARVSHLVLMHRSITVIGAMVILVIASTLTSFDAEGGDGAGIDGNSGGWQRGLARDVMSLLDASLEDAAPQRRVSDGGIGQLLKAISLLLRKRGFDRKKPTPFEFLVTGTRSEEEAVHVRLTDCAISGQRSCISEVGRLMKQLGAGSTAHFLQEVDLSQRSDCTWNLLDDESARKPEPQEMIVESAIKETYPETEFSVSLKACCARQKRLDLSCNCIKHPQMLFDRLQVRSAPRRRQREEAEGGGAGLAVPDPCLKADKSRKKAEGSQEEQEEVSEGEEEEAAGTTTSERYVGMSKMCLCKSQMDKQVDVQKDVTVQSDATDDEDEEEEEEEGEETSEESEEEPMETLAAPNDVSRERNFVKLIGENLGFMMPSYGNVRRCEAAVGRRAASSEERVPLTKDKIEEKLDRLLSILAPPPTPAQPTADTPLPLYSLASSCIPDAVSEDCVPSPAFRRSRGGHTNWPSSSSGWVFAKMLLATLATQMNGVSLIISADDVMLFNFIAYCP
ncbi:hypothetical protein AK812_SmicGene5845 [Symbiodinium microadriaticum]|uniref:Uncharacterized protein n=1 Tax=Symbiodinium microadriaticum TaxID=2951 RepID=A0A1Q9ESR1_SYMMI|nr:hypothetical protein AK812_SmicGene5845 [Symbiodinium microadriaticum]